VLAVRLRSVLLAVVAGAVGLVVGRVLPQGTPGYGTVASAAPAASAPNQCNAMRADLASARSQLVICLALGTPSAEPPPASPAPTAPASAPPSEGTARLLALLAEARKDGERLDRLPEAVIVRHADGTETIYRPDEHPPDGEDAYARKFPDGRIRYYAGPDAGPRSDPDAWVLLKDLADADGSLPTPPNWRPGLTRLQFMKPDAGTR
jgi:hypothetical protein